MAQAIIYCDRCGNIIPPSEIARGKAIVGENAGVCPGCAGDLAPGEIEEVRRRLSGEADGSLESAELGPRTRAPTAAARPRGDGLRTDGRAPSGTRLTRRTSVRAASQRAPRTGEMDLAARGAAEAARSRTGIAVVGLGAGLLLGVAVAIFIAATKEEEPAPSRRVPAARRLVASTDPGEARKPPEDASGPPDIPVAPATAAAKRLAEIKKVFDPWFTDYAEGRTILRAFIAKFPDAPEAEKARARLAEISLDETERARKALDNALRRAEDLASRGMFGDAKEVFGKLRKQFGENEWFKAEAETKIASSLKDIEGWQLKSAKGVLARARALLEANKTGEARDALADHAAWPEEIRKQAGRLLEKIASGEAAAAEEQKRRDAWIDCVIGMNEAGKVSLTEAKAFLGRERKRLVDSGHGEKLARFESRFREAKVVEDMAEITLGSARGTVRVQWKGKGVAGKVEEADGGVLRLKTRGPVVSVPISEIAPADVVNHSRVMRGGTRNPVKAGSYFLLRGDVEAARKAIEGSARPGTVDLGEDIDEVVSAFEARTRREAAKAEAARRAAEAAAEAARRKVLEESHARGLVAHWKFDDGEGAKAADSSGNGRAGMLMNMDDASWVTGKVGAWALQFDGTDDYVVIQDEASFDITDQITVAAWIKVASFTKGWQAIVTKGDDSWRLHRDRKKSAVDWACSGLSHTRWGSLPGKVAADDGRWHHVAGAYDGTTSYLFVDGKVDASVETSNPIRTNNFRVCIGENIQRGNRHFHGIIDDVRIYNRALSADEVKSLFEDGAR